MPEQNTHHTASLRARVSALAFIVFVLVLLAWAGLHRTQLTDAISRDPLALLPLEQQNHNAQDNQLIQKALDHQSQFVSNKLIFFVHGDTAEQTLKAVQNIKTAWSAPDSPLKASDLQSADSQQLFIDFYAAHQQHIISAEQKLKYKTLDTKQWSDEVMASVSRPLTLGLPVTKDPLGNLQNWLLGQLAKSPLQKTPEGDDQIEYEGKLYTVLFYNAIDSTFSLDTSHSVLTAFEKAKVDNPTVRLLAAGIPMHAAAAASQANNEISVFGTISTVAVLGLVIMGFMRLRPVLLVGLSLLVGFVLAYLATYAWFGQVHVVTLVFGTSLIGVAEDYGLHYLTTRQHMSNHSSWQVLRYVMMGLILALLTTVLAYACLAIAPFPGLRQIALFSVVGLLGSWLTVVLLFPFWGNQSGRNTWLSQLFSKTWLLWLRMPSLGVLGKLTSVIILLAIGLGWSKLEIKDDLRTLQNSPQWLLNDQKLIGQALNESSSQFIIVTAENEQALLQREEQVRIVLDEQIQGQHLGGYRAVTEWLPSVAMQKENETLSLPVLKQVSQAVGLQIAPEVMAKGNYLLPSEWLKQPIAHVFKSQWLGQQADGRWANMISLHGRLDDEALAKLKALEVSDKNVFFINSVADYSAIMSIYRNKIMGLLGLAYVMTLAVLWLRYRRQAALIVLPPFLASVVALAVCGWMGVSVQLFSVLPLLLILGMGVDYGIFLVEHVEEQAHLWMTICLGAISTVLSLGLLAFSSTPALHVLGLVLGVGMLSTWVLAAVIGRYVYQNKLQREVRK